MRAFLLFLLLAALVALVWSRGWRPPARYNPWAPLDLAAAPDMFLGYKLDRLGADPVQCQAALRRADVDFRPLADHEGGGGCGWSNAVRLSAIDDVKMASPVMLTCPLAAALVLFQRNALQPQARATLGSPVTEVEHVGSYACRNVYHRDQAPLSRHARADAIDVTGWRLADGRRVSIERDWDSPRAGPFLHAVQARGCRYFGAFLGPDYNAAHRTHFHLQGQGWGGCR